MTTTAQYVAHTTSGEHYYIESDEAGTVVTAAGPLYYRDRTAQNLATRDFDSEPELVDDINDNRDSYAPAEPYTDEDRAMFATINDAYRAYADKFGSEQPVWGRGELRDWIQATGQRYDELTDEDMDAAYEASMQAAING